MNKKLVSRSLIGVAAVLLLTCPAWADVLVYCDSTVSPCNGSGGPIARNYVYRVEITGDSRIWRFHVGTFDPTVTDIIACDSSGNELTDWWNAIYALSPVPADAFYVADGSKAPGASLTHHDVVWRGPTITNGTYYFGFNSSASGVATVSFLVMGQQIGDPPAWVIGSNWGDNVNSGTGPVHGPMPEPTTIGLVALGAVCLLARRRSRA